MAQMRALSQALQSTLKTRAFDALVKAAEDAVICSVSADQATIVRVTSLLAAEATALPVTRSASTLHNARLWHRNRQQFQAVSVRTIGMDWCVWRGGLVRVAPQRDDADRIEWVRGTLDVGSLVAAASERAHARLAQVTQGVRNRFRVIRCSTGARPRSTQQNNSVASDSPDNGQPWWWSIVDPDTAAIGYPAETFLMAEPAPVAPLERLSLGDAPLKFATALMQWLEEREWYFDRGVPWRISVLLEGPPGTGKSSLIRALGQHCDLPLYVLDLSSASNDELLSAWEMARDTAPAAVVLEDIDRIFDEKGELTSNNGLTLDTLLNVISGVTPTPGVALLMTANDVTRLPPALMRPGRVDYKVHVGVLTAEGKRRLASRILQGYPEVLEAILTEVSGVPMTGADLELRCVEKVLELRRNNAV